MTNAPPWLVRAWRGEWSLRALLLVPLGWLWALGATLHRKLFDWGLLPRDALPVPVLSVGNLVVGGAGKTPVTLALAERFIASGRKVAVASRGYGRASGDALVVVSDGESVLVTADEGGDEPVWLAMRCPQLIVTVAAKRVDAARQAMELGAELVLLDDGFSHHALTRREDVLVVDAQWGLGNRRTLPAGPLREPVSNARRASLVWVTRCEEEGFQPPAPLDAHPCVRSRYEATGLVDLELKPVAEIATLRGARVVALCGIARPAAFEQTLTSLGASVVAMRSFGDHHAYTEAELDEVVSVARAQKAELVVTTEKDAMRLIGLRRTEVPVRALRMDVHLSGETEALDALIRRYAPEWRGGTA